MAEYLEINKNKLKSASDLYSRGIQKAELNDLHGAIEDFNKAIEIDSNYVLAYGSRSITKYKLKDYLGAIADADKVIGIEPNNEFAYSHRGMYHLDGRYRIDNNLIENNIRPLALGRKNYMFCGNHDAAENAAIMYSLLGCCAVTDVNPRE